MPTTLCNPNHSEYYSPITFGSVCTAPEADNINLYLKNIFEELIDDIYPVGSYYITGKYEDPYLTFGRGSWSLVEDGKTLLGAGGHWIDLSKWKTKTTQDGAKWARIVYQNVSGASTAGLFPDSASVSSIYESERAWSHLGEITNFYNEDGFLELMLEYHSLQTAARWLQNANPNNCTRSENAKNLSMSILQTDPQNSSNDNVETGIYVPASWKSNWSYDSQFRGLSICNTAKARLNGNVRSGQCWFAVGTYQLQDNGIPATYNNIETTGLSLWVRYDNAMGYNFKVGQTGGKSTVSLQSPYDDDSGEGWLPSHRHGLGKSTFSKGTDNPDIGRGSTISSYVTSATGSNSAHNNMQPYTRILVWKRVE